MFEYGFYDAIKNKQLCENRIRMKFPYPKIIFLNDNTATPDEYILELLFNDDHLKPFKFRVPTLKFLNMSIEEINNNNLVIMMPLYLLKLRKEIAKNKSVENALKLKTLINEGLIKSIIENEKKGSITTEDKIILIEMIKKIYDELYGGIDMFTAEKVTEELDRELVFEVDKIKQDVDKIKTEIATKMLNSGESVDKIKLYTNLSDEQIEKIKIQITNK